VPVPCGLKRSKQTGALKALLEAPPTPPRGSSRVGSSAPPLAAGSPPSPQLSRLRALRSLLAAEPYPLLLLTSAESIYRASNANPYLTSLKC
jgi:hypothetical protein